MPCLATGHFYNVVKCIQGCDFFPFVVIAVTIFNVMRQNYNNILVYARILQ